jgi:hypothetical protein
MELTMISLPITDSEKQRRDADERARAAHLRQATERAARSKVIFPKTRQQQLPLFGDEQ